jgi:predicted RNA-binding Zn ribbon-like protein
MIDVGVLRLQHPDGQVFGFDPGNLAFAFAVTGPAGDPAHARFETFHEPADFERWASRVAGVGRVRASSADLRDAKRLRAAIWHLAESVIDGRTTQGEDRDTLNTFAAMPSLAPRLEATGERSWSSSRRTSELLSTIARETIEVLGGPMAARVKRCEGGNCALLFVDTSRPGNRRWCSMERCGNRAKVSAHRRRQYQEDPQRTEVSR